MSHNANSWLKRWLAPVRPIRRPARLRLTQLEDRTVPSTFTVTTNADSGIGSLRTAITSANSASGADTIVFSTTTSGGATNFSDGSAHTISLLSPLPTITDSLTITGAGPAVTVVTVAIGGSGYRLFTIDDGSATSPLVVKLEKMTLTGGSLMGPTMSSTPDVKGGGVSFTGGNQSGDTLTISDCNVSNNTAEAGTDTLGVGGKSYGGGLYATNVAVTISQSMFYHNLAKGGTDVTSYSNGAAIAYGGGIDVQGTAGPTTLTVTNSTILGNTAQGGKDVVNTDPIMEPTLYSGSADGGGVYFDSAYTVASGDPPLFSMKDTEVDANQAVGGEVYWPYGGAFGSGGYALGGGVDVLTKNASGVITAEGVAENSTFANNLAKGGSVFIPDEGLHYLTGAGAHGGVAFAGGVAISRLVNSTVYGDTAAGGDASAYRVNPDGSGVPAPLFLALSSGPAGGGGFGPGHGPGDPGYLFDSVGTDYVISNSTVSGNTAEGGLGFPSDSANQFQFTTGFGGGVDDGDPTFYTDGSTGGKVVTHDSNVRLYSTIVAGNSATWYDDSGHFVAAGRDIVGGNSYGHNLIGYADLSAPNFPVSDQTPSFLFQPNTNHGGGGDLVGPDSGDVPLPPRLKGFGYYGGLTLTDPPIYNSSSDYSQAIDNGDNLAVVVSGVTVISPESTDQRDIPFLRTVDLLGTTTPTNYADHTDVGAIESRTTKPGTVYAETDWASLSSGTVIADADPVLAGNQPAVIGFSAFGSVTTAVANVAPGGTVIVNGASSTTGTGVFHENVTVDAGLSMILQYGAVSFDSLTIQAVSGSIPSASVEATASLGGSMGGIPVNMGGLQSYGSLTLDRGTSAKSTLLTNTGTSEWDFYAGSVTNVSDPFHSSGFLAGVDLHGVIIKVIGTGTTSTTQAKFVNNGFVADSTSTPGHVIVDGSGTYAGGLYKGSGVNFVGIVTQNMGVVQAGNSPGVDFMGPVVFGWGGISNYLFQIDDANGTAGPTPDSSGHVDGWSLMNATDLAWTADSTHKLTVNLQTLVNPTTVGTDPGGSMDNFDPTQSYSWAAVKWTGTYTGPTDVSALNASTVFDTSAFANAYNGAFAWNLDVSSNTLYLTYTPAP
jgi:hypothetical protein